MRAFFFLRAQSLDKLSVSSSRASAANIKKETQSVVLRFSIDFVEKKLKSYILLKKTLSLVLIRPQSRGKEICTFKKQRLLTYLK